ncbi:MAG: hypothetical protein JWQ71_162 [Pedosphaera sp.]|nr:hypothetical protein [Pedosphaera sp.]
MNFNLRTRSSTLKSNIALAALFFGLVAISSHAKDQPYLASQKTDTISLLAPPPLPGSPEQAADLAATVAIHQNRKPSEAAAGMAEDKFTIFYFTPSIGKYFQPDALPKTEAFFRQVEKETKEVTNIAKDYWKRSRPYTVDQRLAPDKTEKSFSYPSDHSTRATVFALLLADLVPSKREDIMSIGRDIGWHRVVLGKHYPTDIYAGRVLAQAIVRDLKANSDFQHAFAEVKVEITTAQMRAETIQNK